jgi:hypothetical protein
MTGRRAGSQQANNRIISAARQELARQFPEEYEALYRAEHRRLALSGDKRYIGGTVERKRLRAAARGWALGELRHKHYPQYLNLLDRARRREVATNA